MKKWLFLFFIFDLAFIGIVLKISNTQQRFLATENNPEYNSYSDGQKVKYELVKSISLQIIQNEIILQTNYLQSICQTQNTVQLIFEATTIAYAGQAPQITHTFSCGSIKQNLQQQSLVTQISDFIEIQKQKLIQYEKISILKSHNLFVDEKYPFDWRLSSIRVEGENSFIITQAELDKVHLDHRFEFNLSTFVK